MPGALSIQQITGDRDHLDLLHRIRRARDRGIRVPHGARDLGLPRRDVPQPRRRGARERLRPARDTLTPRRRALWEWVTVLIDCSTALALIYLTGSAQSPFLFLVVIPLFFAGRLLAARSGGPRGDRPCRSARSRSSALLEMRGVIPHFSCYPGEAAVADERPLPRRHDARPRRLHEPHDLPLQQFLRELQRLRAQGRRPAPELAETHPRAHAALRHQPRDQLGHQPRHAPQDGVQGDHAAAAGDRGSRSFSSTRSGRSSSTSSSGRRAS